MTKSKIASFHLSQYSKNKPKYFLSTNDSIRNNRYEGFELSQSKTLQIENIFCNNNLAGDEGFEPPITGPEPVALPLGQSPLTAV